jgi:hypothetical protein
MGVCFVFADSIADTTVTDSQGNTWCNINAFGDNTVYLAAFVCASMAGGPNTVTVTYGGGAVTLVVHIMEYQWTYPAEIMALQPYIQDDPFVTYSWGILGGYEWGESATPIQIYYNSQAGQAQNDVTVTIFLGLLDTASIHGWGDFGFGNPRTQTELDGESYAAGEYSVATDATQTMFLPGFSVIYPPGPQTQPTTTWLAFMVVEG